MSVGDKVENLILHLVLRSATPWAAWFAPYPRRPHFSVMLITLPLNQQAVTPHLCLWPFLDSIVSKLPQSARGRRQGLCLATELAFSPLCFQGLSGSWLEGLQYQLLPAPCLWEQYCSRRKQTQQQNDVSVDICWLPSFIHCLFSPSYWDHKF